MFRAPSSARKFLPDPGAGPAILDPGRRGAISWGEMPDPTKAEYLAAGGASMAVILLGTVIRFSSMPPTPKLEVTAPTGSVKAVTQSLRFSEPFHKAQVERDSQLAGVVFDYQLVLEPFPYKLELDVPKTLLPKKEGFSSEHLDISVHTAPEWAGGIKVDHLILKIKNKTRNYLAYRVETAVPNLRACREAAQLTHNAIGMRPEEEITRIECIYRPGENLVLKKVEVVELPAIAYHYVSKLYPSQILMDPRVGASHASAENKRCNLIPHQEIREGAEAGAVTWADVIDFYGRHNCEEYSFFRGYKRQDTPRKLPVPPPAK